MQLKIPEREYNDWKEKNCDDKGYGQAIFQYAEDWAESLEAKITSDDEAEEIINTYAEETSKEVDAGITGFMYGCAVSILSNSWKYGDILRRWSNHTLDPSYTGDKTLNPALICMRTKED